MSHRRHLRRTLRPETRFHRGSWPPRPAPPTAARPLPTELRPTKTCRFARAWFTPWGRRACKDRPPNELRAPLWRSARPFGSCSRRCARALAAGDRSSTPGTGPGVHSRGPAQPSEPERHLAAHHRGGRHVTLAEDVARAAEPGDGALGAE